MKAKKQDGTGRNMPTHQTKTKPDQTSNKSQPLLKKLLLNYENRAFEVFLEYVRAKK